MANESNNKTKSQRLIEENEEEKSQPWKIAVFGPKTVRFKTKRTVYKQSTLIYKFDSLKVMVQEFFHYFVYWD